MNRRGGPHHHFFGGGRVVSPDFVVGGPRAAAVAAAFAALHMLAAVVRALASGPVGLSGVILANAAPAKTLMAACRLTSSVRST
jgi:hypothetical protein